MKSKNRTRERLSRREFITVGATGLAIGFAGCSALQQVGENIGFFGTDREDINVYNETDGKISGTLRVDNPDGERILHGQFALDPTVANRSETNDPSPPLRFADIWEMVGEYELDVSLDQPVQDETEAEFLITIEDTEEASLSLIVTDADLLDPIRTQDVYAGITANPVS